MGYVGFLDAWCCYCVNNYAKMQTMIESICIDKPANIAAELTRKFNDSALCQVNVSKECHVSQSQISRILAGQFRRRSKNVNILCEYANIKIEKHKADPVQNRILMDALAETWDGTDRHAKAIAKVLKALVRLQE